MLRQEKDMLTTLVGLNIKPTAYIMSKELRLNEELEKAANEGQAAEFTDPTHDRLKLITQKNEIGERKRKLYELESHANPETYTKMLLVDDLFEKEEEQLADAGKRKDGKDHKSIPRNRGRSD